MSSIRVGPYVILSVLGTGSFATVYKAVHESSGTIVAVKAIVLAKLDRKALESLENEISVLRKLDHPNIGAFVVLPGCVRGAPFRRSNFVFVVLAALLPTHQCVSWTWLGAPRSCTSSSSTVRTGTWRRRSGARAPSTSGRAGT